MAVSLGAPASARAHLTIDFETYVDGSPIPAGTALSAQFAVWDVTTFRTTAGAPVVRRLGLPGQSGLQTLVGDGPGNPATHPIEMWFGRGGAKDVQLRVLDVGMNGVVLEGFSSAGALLASDSVVHTGDGAGEADTLRIVADGMVRVVVRTIGADPSDGFAVDDVVFHVDDICGNGEVEAGEVCDDGNPFRCDGCAPDCASTDIIGCDIDGACVPELTLHPSQPCLLCDPRIEPRAWSPVTAGAPCDDDLFCTVGDACSDGACVGTPRSCDDGLPCTEDSCNELADRCARPVLDGCLIDGACVPEGATDPGDPCRRCDPARTRGRYSLAPAGSLCDDGDACTVEDACDEVGECAGAARECDDGLSCTTDTCVAGVCGATLAVGCLIDGACVPAGGVDPVDPCRACRPLRSRVAWSPVDVGAPCDDGAFCTGSDACDAAGRCVGEPRLCDDGVACTLDRCDDRADACVHDADASRSCAIDGVCVADGVPDPTDPCRACVFDVSATSWTPRPAGEPCDDGRYCTVGDACRADGTCGGAPRDCADALACTDAACDDATRACGSVVVDGCAIDGVCVPEGGVSPFDACEVCDPGRDPRGWSPAPAGSPCDDGRFCTVDDRCDGAGGCAGDDRDDCDDGLDCTADRCDAERDACSAAVAEGCVIDGACVAALALDPEAACRGCRPEVDRRAYTALEVGAPCEVPTCRAGAAGATGECSRAATCEPALVECPDGLSCADDTRCADRCEGEEGCRAGFHCASGGCRPDRDPGAPCAHDDDCGSGPCVDSVCCDDACEGPCVGCDVVGVEGVCSPRPVGTPCLNGACDGAGVCATVRPDAGLDAPDAGVPARGAGGCAVARTSPLGFALPLALLVTLAAAVRRRAAS